MALAGQILENMADLRSAVKATIQKGQDKEELVFTRIIEELRERGPEFAKHCGLIVDLLKQKTSGELMNDRGLLIERMIQVIAQLPETSFARKKVTEVLVDQLWDSLQHPPLTYVGDQFQFRQADGAYNNITSPNLGRAGEPYARTVRTEVKAPGARPDPGLLFDLLMCREKYEENPAGISSMLLYHASIITHDIFHTNRKDADISDTSSYLDLAPLYGSNQTQQNKVRTFIGGQLKPDTFHEKRLLAFPAGVNVMLVMYSRFHNYVARTLDAINEGGRFTPPRHMGLEEAQRWKDEQLFQTARLIVGGLYVNISLHDYLRAIANVPATDSTWTLDPRVSIKKMFSKEGVPQGVGNQVSCEFNLLYRFHSAISDKDTKWTAEFYKTLFKDEPDLKNLSMGAVLQGIVGFEQSIPEDPSVRTFAGLKRGPNGTFNDDDLVKILVESIEDPAGRFGANHVPDILKPVEILGIIQARKWNVASLNEFRKFFGLREYKKFSEINDNKYVADTLERLYEGNINNVELYPGMFLESCKPRMDAGMGLCAPYTVTRAVFSDAITLVRGDRFWTLDYTPANLTNWGITEVQADSQVLGGAKMHTLILNSFPNHFKFNSVHAMQPFYTPKESKKTFDKLGWTDKFSWERPGPSSSKLIPILSHAGLKAVLRDQQNFKVIWGSKMQSLESYMLAGDSPACAGQRELVKNLLYGPNDALKNFEFYSAEITKKLLRQQSYPLGLKGAHQVDIVKHIANYAALHFAAELCYLPLAGTGSSGAVSYTEAELYKVLTDLTMYVFSDADPLRSWKRRHDSQTGTSKLVKEMEEIIKKLPLADSKTSVLTQTTGYVPKTLIGKALLGGPKTTTTTTTSEEEVCPTEGPLGNYGITFARKLCKAGKTPREVAEILVGTASAFVANTATAFAQLIDFYLESANATHWAEIKRLTAENTPAADEKLTRYVLEGFRLSNSLGLFRIASPANGSASVSMQASDGATITANKGDRLFVSFVAASRDPTVFPNPAEIRLDRNLDSYLTFGEGPHQCLGKDLCTVHTRAMLKCVAQLKNLRRTPGDEGKLKYITKPGGIKLYMNPEWSDFTPYPTTMKLMFDGAP